MVCLAGSASQRASGKAHLLVSTILGPHLGLRWLICSPVPLPLNTTRLSSFSPGQSKGERTEPHHKRDCDVLALGLALLEMVSFTCHSYPERSLLLTLSAGENSAARIGATCLWLPSFSSWYLPKEHWHLGCGRCHLCRVWWRLCVSCRWDHKCSNFAEGHTEVWGVASLTQLLIIMRGPGHRWLHWRPMTEAQSIH